MKGEENEYMEANVSFWGVGHTTGFRYRGRNKWDDSGCF